MAELGAGALVVVIGIDREPTASLVADLRRLQYEPQLVTWPGPSLPPAGRTPIATLVDFRALGVHAEQACRAVQQDRALRKAPIIALVFEQEAPRMDLSLGFDDLVLAPYRLTELVARLRLSRARAEAQANPNLLRAGPLSLNEASYEVRLDGLPLELTLKEYQLLHFFMRSPGRVFTRDDLLEHVWGADYFGGTRTVDVHIRRLRAKTEIAGDLFETVRGVGYRLVVPPGKSD
jgi:DNA-binding response OmpR family regulator